VAGRRRETPSDPDRWLDLAIRYLARVDRTTVQVERFLGAKGATPAQIKQTIRRLSEHRYLNDRAYAERWIESRLARRPMGRERLAAELVAKGLTETVVAQAVAKALGATEEAALARRALSIERRRGRRLTPIRALSLLRQRGFGEDTIERIMSDSPGEE